MSVYKEGYYAVELIRKNSTQIWPDACDMGAKTKQGDVLWNWAKQLCDWYGIKSTKKVEVFNEMNKVTSIYVSLMDEWKTGKTEFFKVTYTKASFSNLYSGFFEVEKVLAGTKQYSDLKATEKEQLALIV